MNDVGLMEGLINPIKPTAFVIASIKGTTKNRAKMHAKGFWPYRYLTSNPLQIRVKIKIQHPLPCLSPFRFNRF
jgi:hypothetical protein